MALNLVRQLFLILALGGSAVSAEQLMLIANVPGGESLDREYGLLLLRGDQKNWDGGIDARVVLPSREAVSYEQVAKAGFGTSGKSMQRLWFRLVFSGRVNPPIYLGNDNDVIDYVTQHEGAIAVVRRVDINIPGIAMASLNP